MMSQIVRALALVSIGLTLATAGGCKHKTDDAAGGDPDAQAVQAAQSLPDGTNILAELDQGDYAAAVAGVMKLSQVATEGPPAVQFEMLKMHVKGRLIELAPTNAQASEALNALRSGTAGR